MENSELTAEEQEDLYEHHRIVVDKGQTLLRIDKFLKVRLPNATRNRIQNGIDIESILVNNKATKANYKVKPNDVVTVLLPNPPRNEEIIGENIQLNIVFEDEDLLIVNKPAGMVVHPAHGNWDGTLVNALVYHFDNLPTTQNGSIRPGLVHRIDKDTSGLLVIAKSERAMTHLANQFFYHTIERTYVALVWGIPKQEKGTIHTYLGRSAADRRVTAVYDDPEKGKESITHYTVLKTYQHVSLIECKLETGRTHQIRAHMKHLGHPLFSDEMYGGSKILRGQLTAKYKAFVENCFEIMPRQALHAKTLGFIHPAGKQKLQFDSELPQDFREVLEKWERYTS